MRPRGPWRTVGRTGGWLAGRTARWLALLAALTVAGTATAGCGLANDAAPKPIPRSQVPFRLLAPASSPTSSSLPVGDPVTVYFIGTGQHLVPVQRFVQAPANLLAALQALVQGPTSAQSAAGYSSAISIPGLAVSHARVRRDGVALVDFNGSLPGGSQQIPAVAQAVYTATAQPGVTRVQFQIAGKPTDVPTDTASEASGPVSRADYALYAPTSSAPVPAS